MKKFAPSSHSRLCERSTAIQSPFPHSSASSPRQSASSSGFTLLELLIVVSIIAILSVALVLVLNPAEALRKSRDSQRMSDLATMKTALGLYLTSTSSPALGNCKASPAIAWASPAKLYYSASTTVTSAADGYGGTLTIGTSTSPALTDGTGWIPVNFDTLTGGSPISNLPIDPVNTVKATADSADLIYRYACATAPLTFEIDAILESIAYASSSPTTDGGNNNNYYEVGTNLKIIGTGTGF